MKKISICLLMIFLIGLGIPGTGAGADRIVKTPDGTEILLKDDHTWSYLEKDPLSDNRNFRQALWGMTQVEVKALDTNKLLLEEPEILEYEGKLAEHPILIKYLFVHNKLVRGIYLIKQIHMHKIDYISDYSSLHEILLRKYGEPVQDGKNWTDNHYKEKPDDWGTAVSIGHLTYRAVWKTDQTEITMELKGDSFKIHHKIEYRSLAYEGLEKKAQDEKVFNEL